MVKNYKEEEWDLFRKTKLWTQEHSDLFTVNLDGIKAVMAHYFKPRKITFTRDDAMTLIMKDAGFECANTEVV